jgi:hypothetical protein
MVELPVRDPLLISDLNENTQNYHHQILMGIFFPASVDTCWIKYNYRTTQVFVVLPSVKHGNVFSRSQG